MRTSFFRGHSVPRRNASRISLTSGGASRRRRALRVEPLEARRLLAVISGQKWHDLDANGVKDAGEPGLNDWTIELVDPVGNVIASTTTADADLDESGDINPETESGLYSFDGLGAGTYVVREVRPADWFQSNSQDRADVGWDLNDEFAFYVRDGYHLNWQGADEKWVSSGNKQDDQGNDLWQYILPNGDLYQWDGQSGFRQPSPLSGDLISSLGPAYYDSPTLLTDAPPPGNWVITTGGNDSNTADFGNYTLTSIHGRKWNDMNANGQQDEGEPFLNDWTIELVDDTGVVIETATTGDMDLDDSGSIEPESESGWYQIDNVPPGTYVVREVLSEGWTQSHPGDGEYAITVVSQTPVEGLDFGNFEPSSIHGRKWHDENGNGVRDEGEPYLNDWTVELLQDGEVIASTTTADMDLDENGAIDPETETGGYWFTGVVPGDYVVREVLKEGWQQSAPEGSTYNISVNGGDEVDGLDFGNNQRIEIHGRKWHDVNGNGQRETEEFLNGWTIELLNDAGDVVSSAVAQDVDLDMDGQIDPATESGWYWFEDLEPGTWGVREVVQDGWAQSAPDTEIQSWELVSGTVVVDADFGNYQPVSVHGRKWEDLTANGMRDADDPYLNEWEIQLVALVGEPGAEEEVVVATATTMDMDLDGDGQIDPQTEQGWYWIADQVPGVYIVREVMKDGWVQSAPPGETYDVALLSGDMAENIDFGNYELASVHGRKFDDLDADGQHDEGEPYLNGWTIELMDDSGNVISTAVTADMDLDGNGEIDPETESGGYWFTDLVPGRYQVREVRQEDWFQSAPDQLADLAYHLDQQFDFFTSDNRFLNWGGLEELWLQSANNNDMWYYMTPNGALYEWDAASGPSYDVPLDGELIAVLDSTYYDDLTKLTEAPEPITVLTLLSGDQPVVDFGNYQLGSVHGRKWNDLNGNGARDEDEPYLNDWTIELLDANGIVISTTVTHDMDLDGNNEIDPETETGWYWFTDLLPGPYVVREVQQDGWVQNSPTPPMNHDVIVISGTALTGVSFGNEELTVDIIDVTPDPRAAAVDRINVVFSHPVNGVDVTDFSFSRSTDDEEPIPLDAATLTTEDNVVWTLGNLTDLTRRAGIYKLALHAADSGIVDVVYGNALLQGADESWNNGPGDADQNGSFNQLDIVRVLQIDKFDKGPPAMWSEGDWNANDQFGPDDLDLSLEPGHYLQGSFLNNTQAAEAAAEAVFEQIGNN